MGLFGFGRKKRAKLSPRQRAQRKYAAGVKSMRGRAAQTRGGKGKIAQRAAARKLRRRLGLKGR